MSGSMVGILRGGTSFTARAISAMWSGVFPQHPPARLMKPEDAKSLRRSYMSSGR